MNPKALSIFVIVLVLGGCIGYGVSLVYTPQILADVLPNNYKSRLDELSQQYLSLSGDYNLTLDQLKVLQGKYDRLLEEQGALTEEFEALSEEYAALDEEHRALRIELNETLEEYNSLLMQYLVVTGQAPLKPQPLSEDTIRRDFAWVYGGKTWALSLYVPEQLYLYYSGRTRVPTEDYSVYVTHPNDDEYISTIVGEFNEISLEEGYSEKQRVDLVIAFVQSLPYTPDIVSTSFDEYPRYPIETLVDGGGDCEDTSILTSALLYAMGYDIVLISPPSHVGVGVAVDAEGVYWLHEAKKYFYIETTGEGWKLGELPDEYQGEQANVYPIIPIPVCTHQWTASILRRRLTIVADVQNVGTAEARGVKLYVAFEGEKGEIWNPEESAFYNIDVGGEITVVLELNVPEHVRTRLIVRVLDPWGNVMDESQSDWFETN